VGNKIDTTQSCFAGNYASWEEAVRDATGYDTTAIFDKVRSSLLKVKRGEAVYERDSVLFDRIEHPFPLLAFLLRIAVENGNSLQLVDFGGSLGTTYFQTRSFLSVLKDIRWAIVEQPQFVACGKEMFADGKLSFHDSIAEAKAATGANTVLLSGVIGYVPKPEVVIDTILAENFQWIIFDRTAFIDAPKTRIVVHTAPESVYSASYPKRLFNRRDLLSYFQGRCDLITWFSSYCDPEEYIDQIRVCHEGFVLRNRISPTNLVRG